MQEQEKRLTVSIYTEDTPGMLNRVTAVFNRRRLNIESIAASKSEVKGLHRYTIVLVATKSVAAKVVSSLEKQVDIALAFVHEEQEVIHREIALYKISTACLAQGISIEQLVQNSAARILAIEKEYIVLETTGRPSETDALYERLAPYGILEFVRSGRVAIRRSAKDLTAYLDGISSQYDKQQNGKSWQNQPNSEAK